MTSRRIVIVGAFGVAAACSSYGSATDESPSILDGGSDAPTDQASADADGGVAADATSDARCATTAPFALPEPLGLGSPDIAVSDARFSTDERTVVFRRTGGDAGAGAVDAGDAGDGGVPTAQLYSATRAVETAPFGVALPFAELASTEEFHAPTLTPDSITLVFARYRGAGAGWDLSSTTRATPTSSFGAPATVVGANAGANFSDFYPYLSADGSLLYFTSSRSAGNSLFVVAFGTGETPAQVERVDAQGTDLAPVVTADGLTMYFARTTAGNLIYLSPPSTIFVAHRATKTDPFGAPAIVAEINAAAARNVPTWISPDACRLYLTSSRGGRLDIYVARRSPQ